MTRDVTTIAGPLLAWHDPAARGLAWRRTADHPPPSTATASAATESSATESTDAAATDPAAIDPYAVLVSEIMAQQTQAARASEAWTRFLQRFPTLPALAAAPAADVIQAWEGLGYNRRAVNLHRCAQAVVADHDGVLPDGLQALEALPGIGPYTARAVLAFAFGRDVVPVDTNVARVLARVTDTVLARPQVQRLADDLAAYGRGPALSAALMDLGAGTCTARRPACEGCPLLADCAWAGGPGPDPAARGDHRPRPQASFAGSARQARGRIVAALRSGPLEEEDALALAGAHGRPVLDRLVADGLVQRWGTGFALPGGTGMSGPGPVGPAT